MQDKELMSYRRSLGEVEFNRLLHRVIYRTNRQSEKRNSGKVYENSSDKIAAIKEKYRNGVTLAQIEEMIN